MVLFVCIVKEIKSVADENGGFDRKCEQGPRRERCYQKKTPRNLIKPKHEWKYVPHTAQDHHYWQNVGNVRYIWRRVPELGPGTIECSYSPRDEVADLCHSTSLGFLFLTIPQTLRNSSASKTEKYTL